MPRDYSSRRTRNRRRKKKAAVRKQGLPGVVWMIMGLTLGLLVAAGVYLFQPEVPQTSTTRLAEAAGIKQPKEAESQQLPPKENPKFAFYEMLPNYEIVVPRENLQQDSKTKTDNKEPKKTPTKIDQPGHYLIQAGSFRTNKDAEARRAQMAMLGVSSNIEKVTISDDEKGDQVWYRVRVGPESNLTEINATLKKLQDNGIDSLLIRVKG